MKFINPISTPRLLELARTNPRIGEYIGIGLPVQACGLLQVLDEVAKELLINADGSLKYGWNSIVEYAPPSGKLQWYTKAGTCIYGKAAEFSPGFVTHWACLLQSPEKQNGGIK